MPTPRRRQDKSGSPAGVSTAPKSRSTGSKGGNKPAIQEWHQGFGTIQIGALRVVPFMYQPTAERIAQQAEKNTNTPMQVRRIRDFWGYLPAKDTKVP